MISDRLSMARYCRAIHSIRRAPEISRDIPVLVGGVKDEMAIYLAPEETVWERTLSEEDMRARIAKVAGDATDRVVATYKRLYPNANPAERLISTLTDSNFRLRSWILAERKAAQSGRRFGSTPSIGRRQCSAAS